MMQQRRPKGTLLKSPAKKAVANSLKGWLASLVSCVKILGNRQRTFQQLIDQGMHSEAEQALVEHQRTPRAFTFTFV